MRRICSCLPRTTVTLVELVITYKERSTEIFMKYFSGKWISYGNKLWKFEDKFNLDFTPLISDHKKGHTY